MSMVVLRLRPIVHASPTTNGLHVRGARSSFTASGGSGLWKLWQALSVTLTEGRPVQQLLDPARPPAVQAALSALLSQLREHDMLVEVPPLWGETGLAGEPPQRIARWLEAVAPDPVAAWRRIEAAEVTVAGTGPVSAAAARALTSAGAAPRVATGRNPHSMLTAREVAVAAAADSETGFVTAVGPPAAVRRDAVAIAERVELSTMGQAPPDVLGALVGGAAAHRLICALAGLPDPAEDQLAATVTPAQGFPAVLIARLDPMRADYHPWLAGEMRSGASLPESTERRIGLTEALSAVDALTGPELGVLPQVGLDELPQLPVALAECRTRTAVVCGVGVDPSMARLVAATGAAERAIGGLGAENIVVGADQVHADGVLLRRLIHRYQQQIAGENVPDHLWATAPTARSWWKALTLRFGVPAALRVRRLAPEVFYAEATSANQTLSWAVERSPADAAAFCALTGAGAVQWRAARTSAPDGGWNGASVPVHAPCGALPRSVDPAEPTDRPWQAGAWIWPAQLADHEPAFQAQLRRLLRGRIPPPAAVPGNALTRALAAAGFVVRAVRS
ncbi:MAG TPA: hypothetical protein VFX61_02485 [Micromonosporaceae bacterium]|nr:hypothetical protein [Micromonosporaceae bacterium]